jgi:hypothetical protein
MTDRVREIMDTALQVGRYDCIMEAAIAAIDRGIDPTSQAMVDAIRIAVPGVTEAEIYDALRWNDE